MSCDLADMPNSSKSEFSIGRHRRETARRAIGILGQVASHAGRGSTHTERRFRELQCTK